MSYWRKLADQVINSLLLAALFGLPQVVLNSGFDWRPLAISCGLVFVAKLAAYRGLNGRP